jgi:hypothetical protein
MVVAAMLAMVAMRVAWSGASSHRAGLAAAGAQDWELAIEHLSRSARWYLPGSSRVREALTTLATIAAGREADGDVDTALAAWREVRRSIRAVRTMWLPNGDLAPAADERIAHLMSGQHELNRAGDPAPFVDRKTEHLALLQVDNAPDAWWSLVVVLAFFGWVAGGFRFVYRAWDEDGEFHSGPALTWAGVITAFMALWIVAMTLA